MARVGLRPDGRAPMRDGVALYDAEEGGTEVGPRHLRRFRAKRGRPRGDGLRPRRRWRGRHRLWGAVRGKRLPVTVATALPFVAQGFKR